MEKQMKKKQTNTSKILQYVRKNALAKPKEVAKATGVPINTVYQTFYLRNKEAKTLAKTAITPKSDWKLASVSTSNQSVYQKPSTLAPNAVGSMTLFADDKVNSPSHYKVGGIETIDFIEAKKLDYHLGNVVKYISRADHKDEKLENLKKAQWYLNRAVSNLEKLK
jgi:prolyl-tRNA editing enzyme YbaK/EbsC (Cys-tRNA(Pro) deacylase)